MKAVEITVKGLVQGIGYRYFVREKAIQTGVNGYVKNLSNGNVLILAEGEAFALEDFIERIKTEHRHASINEVIINKAKEEYFSEFQIKH